VVAEVVFLREEVGEKDYKKIRKEKKGMV